MPGSTTTLAGYSDSTGTSSFSFGGLTFDGTAPLVTIESNYSGLLYGYGVSDSVPDNGHAQFLLQGTDPTIAPTTALGSLHQLPFSEFIDTFSNVNFTDGTNNINGKPLSLSVQVGAAPEPASIALAILAAVAFAWLRRRRALDSR